MSIPASGPLSISAFNVELGRDSNTANSALAGASTPSVGSLFYLANQSGSLNQTPPHSFSEWYGYGVAATSFPIPFMRYDAYSSSFVGTTVSNIGNGGTIYDLLAGNGVTLNGTGTSSYFHFAAGNTGLTSSFLPLSLSASTFTIDFWVRTPGTTGSLYFFGDTGSSQAFENGTEALYQTNNFIQFANFSASSTGWGGIRSASFAPDTWTQFTYISQYTASSVFNDFYIYRNGVLESPDNAGDYVLTKIPSSSTTLYIGKGEPYRVGNQPPQGPATMSFANWAFWTSSLSPSQITALYNEFSSRYDLTSPPTTTTTTTFTPTTTTTTTTTTITTTTSTTTTTTTATPYNVTIYSRAGDVTATAEYDLYYSPNNVNWTQIGGPLSSTTCALRTTVSISTGIIYLKALRDSDNAQVWIRGANSSTCPANLNVDCTYSALITGTEDVAITVYVDTGTSDFLNCTP